MTASAKANDSGENGPPTIDTRGLKCPWPVLRAARAMRSHDTILLLADDPVARTDVPALALARGWSAEMTEAADHVRFDLRKTFELGKTGK